MLAMFVTVHIKPEHMETFAAAVREHGIRSVREDPGCLRWDALQDAEDPNRFYFYEAYRDQAAFEAHLNAPHTRAFIAATRPMRTATPGVTVRANAIALPGVAPG